jgi:AP-3 complex subunit beta
MAALSENFSRLGMRMRETLSERTRDLRIPGSAYFDNDDKGRNIQKQLDSSSDRDKLEAMKRLVAVCHSCWRDRENTAIATLL